MPSLIAGDWAASDRVRLGLGGPDQCGIKGLATRVFDVGVALDAPRAGMIVTPIAMSRARCGSRSSQGPRSTALVRHGCRRIIFRVRFPERRVRGISGVDVAEWTLDQLPLIPFRPCASVELPVFARHEYCTWELDKRAVRSAARRWS
jgi:hypothetical protein